MTLRYPRRIQELPDLEPEEEDEDENGIVQTKTTTITTETDAGNFAERNEKKTEIKQDNKENENEKNQNLVGSSGGGTISGTFRNLRNFPKRSCEIPALDSDIEEDEIVIDDNLNCAILNDSFMISPGKFDAYDNSVNNSIATQHRRNNKNNNYDDISSIEDQITKIDLAKDEKKLSALKAFGERPSLERIILSQKPSPPRRSYLTANVKPIEFLNNKVAKLNSDPNKDDKIGDADMETPLKPIIVQGVPSTMGGAYPRTNDTQLRITPQIRSFSLRRPQQSEACSTQTKKSRADIVNDMRSQKVLFQTPLNIDRAPRACLSSDSFSLFCDTINESGDLQTPAKINPEKELIQTKQKENSADVDIKKTKKSLELAFTAVKNEKLVDENLAAIEKEKEKEKNSHNDEILQIKKIEPLRQNPQMAGINRNPSTSAANSLTTKAPSSISTTTFTMTAKDKILSINKIDYIMFNTLGSGGSSSVYLAKHKNTGKECALKIVDLQGDPVVVEGYLNETKLLAKLQGNPCVVALYDYQLLREESKLYVVMEKGDSDLHKILQTYKTHLPLYILMNFLYQILQAVNYIHQNGVIHSDLKPANFLMVNGRLKLIDFGIASNIAIDSTSIIKFSQAGTFNYISPEALIDTSTGNSPMRRNNQPKIKISTKSDVWSLGCILYLFLYKRTPFSNIKNIYQKISAISSPNPNIEYSPLPSFYPIMLVEMVKLCLQHNPKQRPSCSELLQFPFHMVIPIQNLTVTMKQEKQELTK